MTVSTPQPSPAHRMSGLEVTKPRSEEVAQVLTPQAMEFVATLAHQFEGRRFQILAARRQIRQKLRSGWMPDFLSETASIRNSDWTVASIPQDLHKRKIEITGPVDRKMVINALNSGADVFMADFEDANSPTWTNLIEGQINLRDAVCGTIRYASPEGKQYSLAKKTAVLMVRPRGWHLDEKHVLLDGRRLSASLFDFGLFFFHNAKALIDKGSGPYFYLPKLESHLEARLWNDVFVWAQDQLNIPRGTIRATVLIETILAAFEMDEILYELRDHSAGLNCGRWDYIFSTIKKFAHDRRFLMPDRSQVTMTTPFMRNYSLLTIKTCHRRGIHAMGGMAAQIPIKNDPAANDAALEKVRQDKRREVMDGHDGTWVAHPGLVPIASEEFARLSGDNQIDIRREDVKLTAADLLPVDATGRSTVQGSITEQGIRTNISVGIQYLESWLRGQGCVPINNLMEDAATAEISRAQLWQWVHHGAVMSDGRVITAQLVAQLMSEELDKLRDKMGSQAFVAGQFAQAGRLFEQMTQSADFPEFLTSVAYEFLE